MGTNFVGNVIDFFISAPVKEKLLRFLDHSFAVFHRALSGYSWAHAWIV